MIMILINILEETVKLLTHYDTDFEELPEDIQHVLVNMCFNLRYKNRLGKFKMMFMPLVEEVGKWHFKWKTQNGMDK